MFVVCFWCLLETAKVDARGNAKESEVERHDVARDDDQLNIDMRDLGLRDIYKDAKANGKRARTFTFSQLEAATGNFRPDCFVGEGGFGKVYKGHLEGTDQVG